MGTSIESIVQAGLSPEGDLTAALTELVRLEIRTEAEAHAVASLVASLAPGWAAPGSVGNASAFQDAAHLFQQAHTKAAAEVLRDLGLPALRQAYDTLLGAWSRRAREEEDTLGNGLQFALKIFAMYGGEEQLERIEAAARLPFIPDGPGWPLILRALGVRDEGTRLVERISVPWPPGLLGVALLDKCNELARAGRLSAHPLDNEEGLERMRSWFAGPYESEVHCASAVAAIPFLSVDARGVFLALGAAHPNVDVQMGAAWASARLGDERGLQKLVAWAGEPRTSLRAVAYLEDLGKGSCAGERA